MKRRSSPVDWKAGVTAYATYLEVHRGLSRERRNTIQSVLHRLAAFLEQRHVSPPACTIGDLDAWIAQLVSCGTFSNRTLADYVSILRTFLRYLHGEGHIASTLWIGLEAPRIWQETTAPQHFSWEEVGQLIERVQSDPQSEQRDVALVWLLASAGLRPCEAARMKIADIDWNDATVIVRLRKRNKPLLLPLLPAVVDALQAYIDTERPDNAEHDEVFLNDDGLPCKSGSELSFRVQVLAWKVGLGWGRSGYALRRGLGVRLLESGAGLGQIGLMLGHDDPRSTRVYLRASMNQLKDVADNYANLL